MLGRIAIGDWLTALIGIVSLAVLFRWKVSNPLLIAATAVVGLMAFPLLSPTFKSSRRLHLASTGKRSKTSTKTNAVKLSWEENEP